MTMGLRKWWRSQRATMSQDAWGRAADAVSLTPVDEASAQPRPLGLGRTYAEEEFRALGEQQTLLWPADGERATRSHRVREHGLAALVAETSFLLVESRRAVQQVLADHQHAVRTLSPYVRRGPGAKWRYGLGWPLLVAGDTAGVWSAAVIHGDLPSAAFGQALAAGLSAACAGLLGSELKDSQSATQRQREPETLTDDERRYSWLFSGRRGGRAIVRLIGFVSVLVAALVAVGIGTLRSSVEGSAAGLTFGLLAGATALASGLLGYSAADQVADLLAASAKRARRVEQHHLRLAASLPARQRAEAGEAARSLQAEYQLRGQAASKRMESLAWRTQWRNPQVVGHGYPLGDVGGAIGRRVRRGDGGVGHGPVSLPVDWPRASSRNHTSP